MATGLHTKGGCVWQENYLGTGTLGALGTLGASC
jgi:hypothetical protein